MEQKLTGGAKAGYFFLGFLLSWIGIIIAWAVNKDKPVMPEARKFSIIGAVVNLALGIAITCVILVFFAALFPWEWRTLSLWYTVSL